MADNQLGKKFEKEVQKQLETLRNIAVIRLYDVTMGFKGINNPCDFMVYVAPKLLMLECKAVSGHLLNFKKDIRENQWEKMLEYSKTKGIEAGILVWFYQRGITYYIDINTLDILRKNGKKSFDCYTDIPTIILKGKKKRVFYKYNLEQFMKELKDENE